LPLILLAASACPCAIDSGSSPGGDLKMTEQDRIYYRGRLAAEEIAAARAAHPLAAESHRRLAAEYAHLIAANDQRDRRDSAA
jgi:hypothetical protein